jgi:hypothetical protein
LVRSAGRAFVQLVEGQVALRGHCLLWLPPGAGQFMRIAVGSEGFFLAPNDDLVARAAMGGHASGELRRAADRLIHGEGRGAASHIGALLQAAEALHRELREPGNGGMSLLIAM